MELISNDYAHLVFPSNHLKLFKEATPYILHGSGWQVDSEFVENETVMVMLKKVSDEAIEFSEITVRVEKLLEF